MYRFCLLSKFQYGKSVLLSHLVRVSMRYSEQDNKYAGCKYKILTFIPQSKENQTIKAGKWGSLHCDSPGNVVENICTVVAANHKVGTHDSNFAQRSI